MTSTTARHAALDARTDVLPLHRIVAARPVPPPAYLPPAPPAGLGPMAGAPQAPQAPQPPRPTMRWGWLALGVVAAVLAVATLAAFAAAHRTMTVNGTATVRGYSTLTPGTGCSKTSENGTPVSIYDASGDLVGSSTLSGEGTAVATGTGSYAYSSYADGCRMSFTATSVSASSDFYRVVVGSRDSQGVSYSRDQLASGQVGVIYSS